MMATATRASRAHQHTGEARERAVDQAEHLEIAAQIDQRRDAENRRQQRLARTLKRAVATADLETIRACVVANAASLAEEARLDRLADWHVLDRARALNGEIVGQLGDALVETAELLGMRRVAISGVAS